MVSALNRGGEGDVSDVFSQSTSPAAPTALQSTLQTTTSITLSWDAPVTESGGADVTGYILYRNDGSADGAVSIEVYEADASSEGMPGKDWQQEYREISKKGDVSKKAAE